MRRCWTLPVSLWLLIAAAGCAGSGTPSKDGPGPPARVDLAVADADAAALLEDLLRRVDEAPGDALARGELGMGYAVNGFQVAAIRSYEQAMALDPDDPRWSYLLALARVESGDLAGAREAVETSIALDDSYLSSHLYRGQWLLDLGEPEAAEAAYRRALELEPMSTAAEIGIARALVRQQRGPEAVALMEELVQRKPQDTYLRQILAVAYREAGEREKATEALRQVAPGTQPPGWPDPWSEEKLRFAAGYGADMLQAEALLASGRTPEAIALLQALRKKRPGDLQLLNNLAVAYRRSGREEEALEVLLAGTESEPDYYPFHMNLAAAYERAGDIERALEHLDRVIAINPSLGQAYQRKGMILLGQNRVEEALQAYEDALSRDSTDPSNFIYAGLAAAELEQCERAVRWLETGLKLEPDVLPAMLALGECRARQGDFAGAEAILDRVEQLYPKSKNLVEVRQIMAELRSAAP